MDIFSNFETWTLASKIYFGISVFATLGLIIQLILTLVGVGDTDVDLDVDIDVDMDAGDALSGITGIAYFSVSSMTAFLCFFGWVGFLLKQGGVWSLPTFVIAFVAGSIAFFAVAFLLHFFRQMAHSGNIKVKNAVGEIGTVYITIPSGKNQTGAVIVSIDGRRREYRAMTEDGTEIESGDRVKVTGLLDTRTLIVMPVNAPSEWMEKGI
jgi:membrane-bound ClpP family serine protease